MTRRAALPDVILVESDPALAGMIQSAFQSIGLVVQTIISGTEALDALVALPDDGIRRIVFLSVDLPGMDGHTLQERLRLLRPDRFVIAFMSARAEESDQIRALRGGAIDYMIKPVSIQVLMAKVAVWRAMIARRP